MSVLESGHYYQVRITPHPQECHWNLKAVDSMLLARAALPHGPTPLPPNQPPNPLTAVVSREAGTWHPGHALHCLWRCTERRWWHTRDWKATWRFHLDGQEQLEAIPQRERTAETPAAKNLCPVFLIHQIRALAMGGQLQPAIRTETEAQAAHAALVHEILRALHSALVRRMGDLPGPQTTGKQHQGHGPMNTRGGTIGTTTPRPTRHTRALPIAAGRRQWQGTIPTEGPSRNGRGTTADVRPHTAAHTRHEPRSGHLLMGRQRDTPGTASPDRRPRRLASNQQLRDQP